MQQMGFLRKVQLTQLALSQQYGVNGFLLGPSSCGLQRQVHNTFENRIQHFLSADDSPSLNEDFLTGPNKLPPVFDMLVKFRRNAVAFTADVKQAFLEIGVDSQELSYTRCANFTKNPLLSSRYSETALWKV